MAEAGRVMAQTKAAVAAVRMNTGRMLLEAADVMKRLSAASRARTHAWHDILHTLHGSGMRTMAPGLGALPAGLARASTPMTRRANTGGKRSKRKAA